MKQIIDSMLSFFSKPYKLVLAPHKVNVGSSSGTTHFLFQEEEVLEFRNKEFLDAKLKELEHELAPKGYYNNNIPPKGFYTFLRGETIGKTTYGVRNKYGLNTEMFIDNSYKQYFPPKTFSK